VHPADGRRAPFRRGASCAHAAGPQPPQASARVLESTDLVKCTAAWHGPTRASNLGNRAVEPPPPPGTCPPPPRRSSHRQPGRPFRINQPRPGSFTCLCAASFSFFARAPSDDLCTDVGLIAVCERCKLLADLDAAFLRFLTDNTVSAGVPGGVRGDGWSVQMMYFAANSLARKLPLSLSAYDASPLPSPCGRCAAACRWTRSSSTARN